MQLEDAVKIIHPNTLEDSNIGNWTDEQLKAFSLIYGLALWVAENQNMLKSLYYKYEDEPWLDPCYQE